MARDQFRCSHSTRVRWAEVDPQGVVFNAHYLAYFDLAAVEYWRAIGYTYPAAFHSLGIDTFVVKATLEFDAPAAFDDAVDLLVRVSRLGRTSLTMVMEVWRGNDHLVTVEVVYVFASTEGRIPSPLPQALRDAITGFERVQPE